MPVSLRRIILPGDRDAVIELLVANRWPFHAQPTHTPETAAAVEIESESVASWWIHDDAQRVGLVRAIELDDIEEHGGGCPLFDIRLAEPDRRRGIGTDAVALITEALFERYPFLHRIEATTRDDNVGMQAVLERCGYRLEGRLRETWPRPEGGRADTLLYGILRTDPRIRVAT
jgi:RimJ/RimL family protein N-acetyltransferase